MSAMLNLVAPQVLSDSALRGELCVIRSVPVALRRALDAALARAPAAWFAVTPSMAAERYVLGLVTPAYAPRTGHVRFFYDKGAYLRERYAMLCHEARERGTGYDAPEPFDPAGVMSEPPWDGYWSPTAEDIARASEALAVPAVAPTVSPGWGEYLQERLRELREVLARPKLSDTARGYADGLYEQFRQELALHNAACERACSCGAHA